jgi:hypothetical protein
MFVERGGQCSIKKRGIRAAMDKIAIDLLLQGAVK